MAREAVAKVNDSWVDKSAGCLSLTAEPCPQWTIIGCIQGCTGAFVARFDAKRCAEENVHTFSAATLFGQAERLAVGSFGALLSGVVVKHRSRRITPDKARRNSTDMQKAISNAIKVQMAIAARVP